MVWMVTRQRLHRHSLRRQSAISSTATIASLPCLRSGVRGASQARVHALRSSGESRQLGIAQLSRRDAIASRYVSQVELITPQTGSGRGSIGRSCAKKRVTSHVFQISNGLAKRTAQSRQCDPHDTDSAAAYSVAKSASRNRDSATRTTRTRPRRTPSPKAHRAIATVRPARHRFGRGVFRSQTCIAQPRHTKSGMAL
jgi:hypothetical protein